MKRISIIQHITDDLHMIEGEGRALFPFCNTYISDRSELIAFDPQCGKKRLKRGLKQLGKEISNIDFIVNSHFHADHTISDHFLKKKSGAKILIHEADRIAIEKFEEYVKRYGMIDKDLEKQWKELLINLGFREVRPDQTFEDGDILPGEFQVIHTPGHAPGHCCFYKSEILISGDIDLTSPWVGNLSSDVADYLKSIEKLKKLKIKMILPGHGQSAFNDVPQRLESFRQRLLNRVDKIYNFLPDHPITLERLTTEMFQFYSKKRQKEIAHQQEQFTFHFGRINNLNYLKYLALLGKAQQLIRDGTEYWQRIDSD